MVNSRLIVALLVASALLSTGTAQAGGQPRASRSVESREADYYRIATLPTPAGEQFESGGLLFIAPNTLYCSTRTGDIWVTHNALADPPKPEWKLFARGLHEALTLASKDGWIYATQRGEVTRLKDTNSDDRADIVETFCDSWGINGDYHEYSWGSKFDKDGNMWVLLTLTGSFTSEDPFRGWCLRVTPEGKAIPTVSGIRSPGGIGFNADGDIFYTDNQGPWNGACKLQWLKPGAFVGHPIGLRWFDEPATKEAVAAAGLKRPEQPREGTRIYAESKRIPELLLPAVYFPYNKMGQSASGIACDMSGGKFGIFTNQLFIGDQTHSTVMRVYLEKIDGNYQGACFPFRQGFDSGNLGMEFANDGSLFVFGTDRGWGSRGGKMFALQRMVWTGKTAFEILAMNAKPDGFEFTFTQPVDPETAGKPESYNVSTYTYIYQSVYGSPEVDQTTATVKEARVSEDRKSVRLVIDGLVEGHVHEFHLPGVRSADSEPLLHNAAYYTLNKIPAQ